MPDSKGLTWDDPALSPGQPLPIDQAGLPLPTDHIGLLSDTWDAHAQEWIDWVRAPECQDSYWRFHRDQFLSLVPGPRRLTIDIGCGEGRVGRDLQKLEHKVLGIDLSFDMCRAAVTHPDEPSPAVRADAVRLPLPDRSADCAIAFMSLQDIDDMPGAVDEIARVLEDDCPLILAIVHPMYSGGRFSEEDGSPRQSFVIERSYLQRERLSSTHIHGSLRVTFFREHRPLQSYAQALIKAGFNVENLIELTDEDPSRNRNGIPVFLDIVARRRPRNKPFDPDYFGYAWLRQILSTPRALPARRAGRKAIWSVRNISGVSGLIFIAAIALGAGFY